jgi:hypothetical protein
VAAGIVPALVWLVQRLEAVRRRRRVRRRLAALLGLETAGTVPRVEVRGCVRRWLPAAGVMGAGWVLVGGVTGLAVGMAGAVGLWRWRRAEAGGPPVSPRVPGR